jgi:hypothetical protein
MEQIYDFHETASRYGRVLGAKFPMLHVHSNVLWIASNSCVIYNMLHLPRMLSPTEK